MGLKRSPLDQKTITLIISYHRLALGVNNFLRPRLFCLLFLKNVLQMILQSYPMDAVSRGWAANRSATSALPWPARKAVSAF